MIDNFLSPFKNGGLGNLNVCNTSFARLREILDATFLQALELLQAGEMLVEISGNQHYRVPVEGGIFSILINDSITFFAIGAATLLP